MKLLKVRFKGEEYLFGGDSLDDDGFIATKEQFENFRPSYAHYYPGEGVSRFGEKIGDREDLEIIGDEEVKDRLDIGTVLDGMLDPGWGL